MDFWGTVKLLIRRWYVVLPAFVLSACAAVTLYISAPATYESQASIVLTAPLTGSTEYRNGYEPNQINPLLNFDNNLNNMASILVQAMQTAEFAEQIGVPADEQTRLRVSNGSDNPELLIDGPFLLISAESPSPEIAKQVVERAVAGAHTELQTLQGEVRAPPSTQITLTDIVEPSPARELRGNRARPAAAALVVGLATSLFAALAVESMVQSRRRLRQRTANADREDDQASGAPLVDNEPLLRPTGTAPPSESTPRARDDERHEDSAERHAPGSATVSVSQPDDRV